MVLVTIESDDVPTVRDAARLLKVSEADIDSEFGIVPIDPELNLYSVRVVAGSIDSTFNEDGSFRGPFSDPKIAPMR